MDEEILVELFEASLQQFLTVDRDNILNEANERNWCGRLMLYMHIEKEARGLTEYFVETEYNRKQNGEIKTIMNGEMKVVRINCDIILHSRGNEILDDNLIAVEMKKSDRPENEKNADRDRLRALTKKSYDDIWAADGVSHPEHVCGYIVGYYVELNATKKNYLLEVYQEGEFIQSWTKEF